MRRTELAIEQMEDVNGGMYQGYDGEVGVLYIRNRPWNLLPPPGILRVTPGTPVYLPDPTPRSSKIPPHTGMSAGWMAPGGPENNRYQCI